MKQPTEKQIKEIRFTEFGQEIYKYVLECKLCKEFYGSDIPTQSYCGECNGHLKSAGSKNRIKEVKWGKCD